MKSKYHEGVKARIVGWVGHVACMREIRNGYIIFRRKTGREEST
jgi:hypothetical protein